MLRSCCCLDARALQQQQRRLLVALVLRARRVCAVRHLQPLGQRGELDLQRGGGGVRLPASPSRSCRAVPLDVGEGMVNSKKSLQLHYTPQLPSL